MSKDYSLELIRILDEGPVSIHGITVIDGGLLIDFVDADEQLDTCKRAQSWAIDITNEEGLEAFGLLQDIGRVLVNQVRVAERGGTPPIG